MSIVTRMLRQSCTYWGTPVPDGYGGYTFATPVTLTCRWEGKREMFTDMQGNEVLSQAVVYVGSDVVTGGYLYLGTSVETDPTSVDGAYQIRQFGKLPNLRVTEYLRTAWL